MKTFILLYKTCNATSLNKECRSAHRSFSTTPKLSRLPRDDPARNQPAHAEPKDLRDGQEQEAALRGPANQADQAPIRVNTSNRELDLHLMDQGEPSAIARGRRDFVHWTANPVDNIVPDQAAQSSYDEQVGRFDAIEQRDRMNAQTEVEANARAVDEGHPERCSNRAQDRLARSEAHNRDHTERCERWFREYTDHNNEFNSRWFNRNLDYDHTNYRYHGYDDNSNQGNDNNDNDNPSAGSSSSTGVPPSGGPPAGGPPGGGSGGSSGGSPPSGPPSGGNGGSSGGYGASMEYLSDLIRELLQLYYQLLSGIGIEASALTLVLTMACHIYRAYKMSGGYLTPKLCYSIVKAKLAWLMSICSVRRGIYENKLHVKENKVLSVKPNCLLNKMCSTTLLSKICRYQHRGFSTSTFKQPNEYTYLNACNSANQDVDAKSNINNGTPNMFSVMANNSYMPNNLKQNNKNYAHKPKHYPPANKEWFNSIYAYNSTTAKVLPVADKVVLRLIKSYFNFTSKKLEKKLKMPRIRARVRRMSTDRMLVSKAEIKHTADKAIITIYVFNRQKKYYLNKIKVLSPIDKIDRNLSEEAKIETVMYGLPKPSATLIKKIKSKALDLKSRLKSNNHKFIGLLKGNGLYASIYKDHEIKYLKHYAHKSLRKEILSIYYKQLISFNKSKFENVYVIPFTKLIERVYRKKVEFNFVDLKYLYLNSYLFSNTLVTKLRNRKNKLLTVLKTSLLMFTLPRVDGLAVYNDIYNRKKDNTKPKG